MATFGNRFLVVYSGVLTLALALIVLLGAANIRTQKFDVLDVQRINISEPDGTLRAVISNQAMLPGLIVKGKEYPHERPQAGMLFYNDEGTENGGFGFGGAEGASEGSLSFDAYQQDQIFTIFGSTRGNASVAGMSIADRPKRNIVEDIQELPEIMNMSEDEQNVLMQERMASGYYGQPRMFVGKQDDGSTAVDLMDKNGVSRLRFMVSAEGEAVIEFLDAEGQVTRSLTPDEN
jgi:hypothetical protein